jgi:hypothetical protein
MPTHRDLSDGISKWTLAPVSFSTSNIKVGAIAPISLELHSETTASVPVPRTHTEEDGTEVPYAPGEAISMGIAWVGELLLEPKYQFFAIGGATSGARNWCPAPLGYRGL